jgi:hypothetical protein
LHAPQHRPVDSPHHNLDLLAVAGRRLALMARDSAGSVGETALSGNAGKTNPSNSAGRTNASNSAGRTNLSGGGDEADLSDSAGNANPTDSAGKTEPTDGGEADLFDGVDDRQDRDHRRPATADRSGDGLDQFRWGEGTRGVVHKHDADVRGHDRQRRRDRVLALGAARHHGHRDDRGEQGAHRVDLAGGSGHDDQADGRGCRDAPDGVHQEGLAGEQAQGLRPARAQAEAGAGGRNEDRDVTASVELRGHVAVLFDW